MADMALVPLSDVEELAWQERALCAQTDPEAFFPEKGGSTRDAKKICASCEVRSRCLEYALENDERFGIWGGLSERERRKLRKRAEELEGLRTKHSALTRELETLSRLSQVMRGFKENVIARIVPTLSDVSSDLLSQLTEGKYGGMRLDENYQMWLYDQGEEFRLERFSGGEVDLANLCLRLAISRMIMERSGNQLNFLVLDEPASTARYWDATLAPEAPLPNPAPRAAGRRTTDT